MVVLAVIAILMAVAIPSALHYFKLAEFRKNESNAKTVYLAAESALTWYRNNGEWEDFRKEVVHKGVLNQGFGDEDAEKGRIYAITMNRSQGETAELQSGELVKELLSNLTYDGDFFNASIAVEIDVDTGQVYSAFYGTRCNALKYELAETDQGKSGILEIGNEKRAYEDRRKVLLGYYSVEDVTNVVDIRPVPLKVTSINLVNSETLSLNWSGNSRHDNLDVEYTITFYEESGGVSAEDRELFSLQVDRYKLPQTWKSGNMAPLKLSCPSGGADVVEEEWNFPLYYQDGRFSLVLDGMMSARLRALLDARNTGSGDDLKTQKAFNVSITRLGERISALELLKEPRDIYAVIQGQCTYHGMEDDIREYSPSSPVKSNTENTLFADVEEAAGTGGSTLQQVKITRFRHLSNIRYFDKNAAAEFALAGSLDWTASGGGVYDVTEGIADPVTGAQGYVLSWESVVRTENGTAGERILDFPSVPLLSENHVFRKQGAGAGISNLHLGAGSVADDEWIRKLYPGPAESGAAENHYSNYLGLFCEMEGKAEGIVFRNPLLVLRDKGPAAEKNPTPGADAGAGSDPAGQNTERYAHLYGVGLLCGRCSGSVDGVSVKSARRAGGAEEGRRTVEVYLTDREAGTASLRPAGIGGLIGVLAYKDTDGPFPALGQLAGKVSQDISLKNITVEGAVAGALPEPDPVVLPEGSMYALALEGDTEGTGEEMDPAEEAALGYRYGIGGIIGYAWVGDHVKIAGCENRADVTGNFFTGGVCGKMTGNYEKGDADPAGAPAAGMAAANIIDCGNEGLVLCSVKTADVGGGPARDMASRLEGRYFGGILGFGDRALVQKSQSASGRGTDTSYRPERRDELLQGWYVGGILGFGCDSLLLECGTEKGGYILGSDYVGGIAGGLSSNIAYAIKGDEVGTAVTTNECYVIGNRYVGGIVGKNDGNQETVIRNCVNNGAAAGYDRYIGGIVGYNGKNGKLEDCASYLSDYNNAVFNRIVKEWKALGDCSGGLVGYNNGEIAFSGTNQAITVKSVAGIAIGRSCVGGVVGFNDAEGTLDVHYTLIGGRVYASGDAAGGCIGLNASPGVLTQKLAIKPQSVEGRYYVGGVIGADVVDLPENKDPDNREPGNIITAGQLETDNVLGSIRGEAFVGGVIGYHRTYTQAQLEEAAQKAGMILAEGETLSVLDYLWFGRKAAADPGEYAGSDSWKRLLPELDGDNIPGEILESENTSVLRFTKAAKTQNDSAWKEDSNNMSIRAYVYVGGIVGYCERNSLLYLADCKNVGGISKPALSPGEELPAAAGGVSLAGYLEKEAGITLTEAEKAELGDLKVCMAGGMISANLRSHVIDSCVNKGSMNGFVGLGGIVGFNAGGIFSCSLEDNFGSSDLDYIGGIAGLNAGSYGRTVATEETPMIYRKDGIRTITYRPGTIARCAAGAGRSVLGRSYVGGIAGYNMQGGILEDNRSFANVTASGDAGKGIAYTGGIAGCNNGWIAIAEDTAETERAVRADQGAGVGGIAGVNLSEGRIYVKTAVGTGEGQDTGNGTGGAGREREIVVVGTYVTVAGRLKVGGIVGINRGRLSAEDLGPDTLGTGSGPGAGTGNVPYLTCQAREIRAFSGYAGGIAGEAEGDISGARNRSGRVMADQGPAGGIVAVNGEGITLSQCRNYGNVNADRGYAGGISAENYGIIKECRVGYAEGPGNAAESGAMALTISSRGVDAIGAVCAVNHGRGDEKADGNAVRQNARLYDSVPLKGVTLSGNAEIIGGIAGINRGVVGDVSSPTVLADMPKLSGTYSGRLTVGFAVGENIGAAGSAVPEGGNTGAAESGNTGAAGSGAAEGGNAETSGGGAAEAEKQGTIRNVTVDGIRFGDTDSENVFRNIAFLGGIAGRNRAWGEVLQCSFRGSIIQDAGNAAAGDCYGGISGANSGWLKDCSVRFARIDIKGGVYTATSLSTAAEKEALSTHVGGICGKNERYTDKNGNGITGRIVGCVIEGGTGEAGSANGRTEIMLANGMAGGIAGYNKGEIELSGDSARVVSALLRSGTGSDGRISSSDKVESAADMLKKSLNEIDEPDYVAWQDDGELESFRFAGTRNGVNGNRTLSMILSNNGNVGGITAYNAPSGSVNYCATGEWYLNNKSNAIGVGTGGIIGMNESEQNLSYLLNKAFVGRQLGSGDTNRFAGGIIGNQNNTTKSGWKIENCVNYGTVYCLNTHYSGGILGQWTGTGGTLEHCYNYGNLQTTYERGWLGAAGGIVAQLYHAYEGNYYNIVGCGNYGNIYGRDGKDRKKAIYNKDGKVDRWVINNCANDSAGILGNITAYEAKSAGAAQGFAVQVLDCVNGSGVEIYSTSMASGIVGFVSCDNADNAGQISTATGNIELRIERCRNFAAVLEGGTNRFCAGIFGDRYGKFESGNKTVIKDCYSVNPQAGRDTAGYHYYDIGYPIISYRNTSDTGSKPGTITAERNFFLEDGRNGTDSFVNSDWNNDYVMRDDSSTNRLQTWTRTYTALSDTVGRTGANRAYKVRGTSGRYYVITVNQREAFGSDCTIQADGKVVKEKGGRQIGQVLFDTDMVNFSQLYAVGNVNSVMVRNSKFDEYVRLSYRRIEGAEEAAGGRRMPKPAVSLEHSSGSSQVTVKVTPGAAFGGASDPFKYVATLYKGDRVIKENFTFYSEEAAFEIAPEDAGETGEAWRIEVTAHSMYDDVAPSETATSVENPIVEKVLPNPDIRIELAESAAGNFTYRYRLRNMADYGQYTDQYDIYVKFMDAAGTGSAEIKLGENGEITREQASSSLQQLLVQARPKDTFKNGLLPSAEISVPVYLPGNEKLADGRQNQYHPSIPLKGDGYEVSYNVTGTNLSDVCVEVTLDASKSGNVTTPPVYRVELIGTWGKGTGDGEVQEAVLAYQDVLAAANGTASASFTNLDQHAYVTKAEDLQVRVWYAASGLGPVYTWHSVDADNAGKPLGDANVSILAGVREAPDGDEIAIMPEWNYEYSTPLASAGREFQNYVWTSEKDILTWLSAPNLMEGAGEENFLMPEYPDPDKELHYTFKWDQEPGEQKARYKISLAGIDRETRERVSLVTDEIVADNSYSVSAEDWDYSQVELTVTSLGDGGRGGTIGLSSDEVYTVASRLPGPGQPVVTNTDVNEMIYRIEWSPVVPETGCVSYQIYMRFYQGDGTLGAPAAIGKPVSVKDKHGNRYVVSDVNLEDYLNGTAAERALVYIVAQADETKPQLGYVDSLPGITYELQIPTRIPRPNLNWGYSWIPDPAMPDQPDRNQPLSAEAFRQNGMTVSIVPNSDSIPPGGSTYLLAAWVVDGGDAGAVKQVIDGINAAGGDGAGRLPQLSGIPGLQAVYPSEGGEIVPVQMDVDGKQVYRHSMNGLSAEHAGKYIFFCTRISSGNGQFSSRWVASDLVRLPYVRLSDPVVTGEIRTREAVMTTYTNPDLPDINVQETWNVNHIGFRWNSVEYADAYYVSITPGTKDGSPAPPVELKIVEERTGDAGEAVPKAYVKQADGSWQELGRNAAAVGIISFEPGYSREIKGKYEKGDGVTVLYAGTLSASIEAVRDENGKYIYTLILPDAADLVTKDGMTITGDDLRNTDSVAVRADVKENESEAGSGSYVGSNTVENQIGN